MSAKTSIEWTDYSSNPIKFQHKETGKRGHACVKVSPACKHCYAERWNVWRGTGQPFSVAGMAQMIPYLDEKELNWLLKSSKISGQRVFIEDMSDLFGEWVPFAWIDRIFDTFAARQDVIFQVLTKRSGRMLEWYLSKERVFPQNVWMGVSLDNVPNRVADLQKIPASVRFLSIEPLTIPCYPAEGIEPDEWSWDEVNTDDDDCEPEEFVEECEAEGDWINCGNELVYNPEYREWRSRRLARAKWITFKNEIHWVIVGGESGQNARPTHPDWVRSIRDWCQDAGIAFFFKQWGEWLPESQIQGQMLGKKYHRFADGSGALWVSKQRAGRLLDGRTWDEMPGQEMEVLNEQD